MCPLRRVEGHRASPSALGILTPPGQRTFLILRPRTLSWDLLLLRPGSASAFRELPRLEANRLADELLHALRGWSDGASGHVEEIACPEAGGGYWVRVCVGPFALLVCGRQPGQPYQPMTFPDAETALSAAAQLRGVLRPAANVDQEVYVNSHHFQQAANDDGNKASLSP